MCSGLGKCLCSVRSRCLLKFAPSAPCLPELSSSSCLSCSFFPPALTLLDLLDTLKSHTCSEKPTSSSSSTILSPQSPLAAAPPPPSLSSPPKGCLSVPSFVHAPWDPSPSSPAHSSHCAGQHSPCCEPDLSLFLKLGLHWLI